MVCGYAVDVLRSCYESTWHFPGVGDVAGYYYFRPWGTPFYPGLTYFGSRNWHAGDGTDWPEFGEKEHVRQKWRDGSFPTRPPELVTVGPRDCIEGETSAHDSTVDPPAILLAGVPLGCWPHGIPWYIDATGGAKGDGSAGFGHGPELVATGGAKGDGSAETSLGFLLVASGGAKGDGSAELTAAYLFVASGGAKGDGSAETSSARNLTATGGAKGDGAAATSFTWHLTADGGGKGDGAGTFGRGFLMTAAGGGKSAGNGLFVKDLYLQSTNTDTTCDVASVTNRDLGLDPGSGTETYSTSSTSYVVVAVWDKAWLSQDAATTGAVNVTSKVGTLSWRFRFQAIKSDCTSGYDSAYSGDFTTAAPQSMTDSGWQGASSGSNRVRLSLELKKTSGGGSVSITVTRGTGCKLRPG